MIDKGVEKEMFIVVHEPPERVHEPPERALVTSAEKHFHIGQIR
jgi:hypothetical protein